MRRVLFEDVWYSYLQNNAKERLKTARQLARNAGLDKATLLPLEGKTCCIFPWMGNVPYHTLERWLNFYCRESLGIKSIGGESPYFLTIKLGKSNLKQLSNEIASLCEKKL